MAKLLAILNIIAMPKGLNKSLNPYLNTDEIDCKCSRSTCHYTLVNEDVIQAFYEIRLEINRPLRVNSFYRCQVHNEKVGGVETSSHTTGNAIDISTYGLSEYEKEKLEELMREKFDYVKVYKNFIHAQFNV